MLSATLKWRQLIFRLYYSVYILIKIFNSELTSLNHYAAWILEKLTYIIQNIKHLIANVHTDKISSNNLDLQLDFKNPIIL